MNHDEIQSLLEGYVDETLDKQTRRAVDAHLSECEECRAILEDVHPIDLSRLGPAKFDERTMRRVVRRSIFRTAVDAALLLVAGALVVGLLSALLVQPLIVNRGGRAAGAVKATVDIATLINPGAVVTGLQVTPGVFSRDISVEVALPVGSGSHDLGPIEANLGPLNLTRADGSPPFGFIGPEGFAGDALDQLTRLGSGTVATVAVTFEGPMSLSDAQGVAGTRHDVRLVWAGFDVSESGEVVAPWPAGGVIGYSTCQGDSEIPDEVYEATSSGFGRSLNSSPASIRGALRLARDGIANIAADSELTETAANLGVTDTNLLLGALTHLDDSNAAVRMIVLTGPTDELLAYLKDPSTPANTSHVLAVDFYNWSTPVCGR